LLSECNETKAAAASRQMIANGSSRRLADIRGWSEGRNMTSLASLSHPHIRDELTAVLSELEADDPLVLWERERQRGLASSIDAVLHFLFDDHDFDVSAVGYSLVDEAEVRSITTLKLSLEAILGEVGDAGDTDFVAHPLWIDVKRAAAAASKCLRHEA
jgi:hypothetical protein